MVEAQDQSERKRQETTVRNETTRAFHRPVRNVSFLTQTVHVGSESLPTREEVTQAITQLLELEELFDVEKVYGLLCEELNSRKMLGTWHPNLSMSSVWKDVSEKAASSYFIRNNIDQNLAVLDGFKAIQSLVANPDAISGRIDDLFENVHGVISLQNDTQFTIKGVCPAQGIAKRLASVAVSAINMIEVERH